MDRHTRRFLAGLRLHLRRRLDRQPQVTYPAHITRELALQAEDSQPELRRIIRDPRTAEAFGLLSDEHTALRVTEAAHHALMDYRPYREAANRAELAADEIAKKCDELQKLLGTFFASTPQGLAQHGFSVQALLHGTENPSAPAWAEFRGHVTDPETPEAMMGWSWAPRLDAVIGTLADQAREFQFDDLPIDPAIIAARAGRNNQKTQYLRALLVRLECLGITVERASPAALRKAVAIVATVALDYLDIVVCRDDIDKLLK